MKVANGDKMTHGAATGLGRGVATTDAASIARTQETTAVKRIV